jgi:hypothetical protein
VLHDHSTSVAYRSASTQDKPAQPTEATATGQAFSLYLDSISIERNGLALDDAASAPLKGRRFDASHMHLQDILLKASSVRYDSTGYAARIRQLSFRDANGFTVSKLRADARFSDTALALDGLVLETKQNKVSLSLDMAYKSLDELLSSPATTRLNLAVSPSVLRLEELGYFLPELVNNAQLRPLSRKDIRLNLNAKGTLDQLELADYRVQTGGNLIRGRARLLHPTDPQKLQAQVALAELRTGKQDIKALLAPGTIPDSAWRYIPDNITVRGTLNGSMQSIRPDLQVQSSFGNLSLRGLLEQPADAEKARYDLWLQTTGLALGQIIEDSSIGSVAGKAHAQGRGYNPETMQADVEASIGEAEYNGYAYNSIDLKGTMDHGDISATLASREPNLDLDADMGIHFGKKISDIRVKSDIRQADLQALGFMDSAFSVRGKIDIDFPVVDSNRIEGRALLNDLAVQFSGKSFFLDTVNVEAYTKVDSQVIAFRSPIADVEMKGHYSLSTLPGAAKTVIDNWLVTTGELETFPEPVFMELNASVHIPDSLAPLVPGLKSVSPFIVQGGIDTRQNILALIARIPAIAYQDYQIDSALFLVLQVDTVERYKKTQYVVQLKQMQSPSFKLDKSQLLGQIEKGVITSRVRLYDEKNNIRYLLPFTFVNDPVIPYLSLQDTILLNSTRWQVNPDNRIFLDPQKLKGSSLVLSQGQESISLAADPVDPTGLPLTLSINAFHLESLTGMLIGSSKLLTGTANGKARMTSISPIAFDADLGIDSLTVFGSSYGNFRSQVEADTSGTYTLDMALDGSGNDVRAAGNINASSGDIDLRVNMAPLNLQPVAPFMAAYVDSLRGGLRGNLAIGGSIRQPIIDGTLGLDSSYMIIRQTGTPLYIPEAALAFNGQQISFEGMTLQDSARRPATITGTGRAENLTDITYDLKVQSQKFLVSGRRRYEEQLVSGPLYAGMTLTIKGDLDHASINGTINVNDSSEATYVYVPDDDAANGDGLIEFFDPVRRDSTDSLVVNTRKISKQGFQLDVNSYIKVTPSTTVNIILDQNTGDQLTVKGNANLNFTMDAGGAMEMTGNYEVESGNYTMTIGGLLRKSFSLQKGSTITWSGDILEANTDLTAKYTVRTDAEELLREVEAIPGANRQKFDFEVYMQIKGELLKPAISFRLDMPPKEQSAFNGTVYTRLRQVNSIPSELNKQVMGLLALNSFIADNPFNSLTSGGGSFETQAFSTAGRLLTQELNNFLGNVIKDVDIDIGLDIRDDYTSGEAQRRSDLKVGFTKSLANNRLSIYVGNTFALEQHNQSTNAMAGLAGDVSIEYMLTNDGKYRIKGYRLTEEDLTFNGIVVETGVTFVVVLEFNRFKNAFRSKKKRNTVQP